ncbi:MAG: sugar phosphate nucleotidyltransferase [Bacilli bacterium]|nr:sugar phosphate nucleotidyltransferase [Bacilli bacterium]
MKKDMTLLIMAAGMGSRFGGLKQIEPVGPNGEFLIDYSIYDAIEAGFTKVVFVIKKENEEVFKETIGKRIPNTMKVFYAFQDIKEVPQDFTFPEDRVKPWGTSHAIMAAESLINEPFAIINADDFYGRDAYQKMATFLRENEEENQYCLIGYQIHNTLSENGSVKRGICITKDGLLEKLIESSVERKNGDIIATPLDGSEAFKVSDTSLSSMNMLGFTPSLFPYLKERFPLFLEKNKEQILKCEYLIPDSMYNAIREGFAKVSVIQTSALWQGITYKEDKEKVMHTIQSLTEEGEYPSPLWER